MKPKKSKSVKKPKSATEGRRPRVPRAQPAPQTPWMVDMLHQRIAVRAYELYERRARVGPLDDWLQAEREILKALKVGTPRVR